MISCTATANRRLTRPDCGFTLLELLVAMSLLGLVSAMIASGLSFGLRAWDTGGRTVTAISDARQVERLVRTQIAGMSFSQMRGQGRKPVVAFWGGPESVRFIGRMPDVLSAGGRHIVEYTLEDGEAGRDLVLRYQPVRADERPSTVSAEGPKERLLPNVRSLRFSYYGPRLDGAGSAWQDNWTGRDRLPALVRLSAKPDDTADWTLPDATIAIETEGTGG